MSVPDMHCAACISGVEKTLLALPGVEGARANLSSRTVAIIWQGSGPPPDPVEALAGIGYTAHATNSDPQDEDRIHPYLLRALAVAGFCSMNIMLLSVSVWAGANGNTRQAFHMLSAALALPAVVYSGIGFYRSSWHALARGTVNMDVPVSAGVLLSFGLSVYDAATGSGHAYFEASTSLLFVLLGGRVLDQMMRRKAKSAVSALARIMPRGANMIDDSGRIEYVPIEMIRPGARLIVAVGDRVPTDGIVSEGQSEIDGSLVSGESSWRAVVADSEVRAGEINRGQPFSMKASVAPENSILSEMTRMMAAAEDGRASYRRIADRAASLYAPLVHSFALLAFVGWFQFSGDLHKAITIAVAVLVVTCPCALGIAVPMVQVVLARRLFDRGVMGTDGSAYERLAEIDTVVLDKTGTLTTGEPSLLEMDPVSAKWLGLAASIACWSSHPYCKALYTANNRSPRIAEPMDFDEVREVAGYGMEARSGQHLYRLGRSGWAMHHSNVDDGEASSVALTRDGVALAHFGFGETLRSGAAEMIRELSQRGLAIRILSGDSQEAVSRIAGLLGVKAFSAGLLPGDKVDAIAKLQSSGSKVLMIGDGINDAPVLRASHVSMAPSSASDIGRSAVDFVFVGGDLDVVSEALDAVQKASRLVRQNFMLAAIYNALSLPLALAGFVTPLIATIAMSTSSTLVVANALRLGAARAGRRRRQASAAALERIA